MLDLIEPLLERSASCRSCGSMAACRRRSGRSWCIEFQTDPDCRFFLTTNAGCTGLNLQAANTVINVDLPWNPAVLEQRIARAHRMGQKQPVQVFVLVTEGTIEENLLQTLRDKQDLALAALDATSDVDVVLMATGNGRSPRAAGNIAGRPGRSAGGREPTPPRARTSGRSVQFGGHG